MAFSMPTVITLVRELFWRNSKLRTQAWLLLPVIAVVSFAVKSASSDPLPPIVNLSTTPLYSSGIRDKPTLTLALSVEFPTVGAQYTPGGSEDNTYSPLSEYLGYFDSESCYSYHNDASAELRRFDRTGEATNHGCGGTGFSGNFMNWATSSAIDVLRLGLTGGDRIVDTSTLTVLQRAVLPTNFWNTSNFPAKRLTAALAANAVPNNLKGTFTGDIWVANCLNRVHFGSEKVGNCGAPGNNSNLGIATSGALFGPVSNFNGTLPADFSTAACANENGTCNFTGVMQVAYGAGTTWRFASAVNTVACTNGVFGDPIQGTVKKCFTRADPTGWSPLTPGAFGSAPLSSDGFFYSRVKVCEADSSGILQDPRSIALTDRQRALCSKYPSSNYKPVGQLQKNSDNVRVAAFGYLMDSTQNPQRYGGVLRAPMKYVGSNAYDSTGNLMNGANPKLEWNENTGVFVANSESANEGKSGVINYLNQFGRTGATQGSYKTYDPVSELYYEALRYVQGLGSTPKATEGITDAMKDGFPVYTNWTDPHAGGSSEKNYSCIRNNIVVIGDVNTHNDKSIPGNTTRLADGEFARSASDATNEPDFTFWTKVVGGFESNTSVSYIDGKGVSRNTSNPNTIINSARWGMENQNIGSDKASHYIAGMAYWGNTHDIRGTAWTEKTKQRPGMRVSTYILDVNEYGTQNDTNTRRYSNQFFLASKYGGFDDKSETGNPFLDKNGQLDNSNWQRYSDPGEANNYFLSSNSRAVLKSLENIFESISKKGNSIAGSATSSQQLKSDNYIYGAQFDPAAWSGDVTATQVFVDSSSNAITLDTSAKWSAATELDKKEPSTRMIVVGKTTASSASTATLFTWSTIEADLKAALNKATSSASSDSRGENRINYLRGDRSLETSTTSATLRRRASRLGDIVNSGVVMSGLPSTSYNDSSYSTFYNTNKTRPKTLFVGANDGMLHAFNADTGNEIFAYIPSWLGSNLSALTNDTYVTNHLSYVDATPAVNEAQVGNSWKTVLVGGTGAGGQGVYALDVSNPTEFAPSKVMWEFTDLDDADMGNVIGQPKIRKFRVSASSTNPAVYKWFAVVASGVNNHFQDGHSSTTGKPAIFLLDLGKPAGTAWSEGSNYFKISFPIDSTLNRAPGLANFSVTESASGAVQYLYAGDLHGRMWKLAFSKISSAASTTSWTLDRLSVFSKGSPLVANPFFIAKDGSGVPQPITMAPNLPVAPNDKTVVIFGTGKYLESADNIVNSSTQIQSLYAIYDTDVAVNDNNPANTGAISGRSRLQAGSISSGQLSVSTFVWGRPLTDGDLSQRSGWYVDFSVAGERQFNRGETAGTNLVFTTGIPPSSATQACGTGSGYQYLIDIFQAKGTVDPSKDGLLSSPLVFNVGDGVTTASDSVGRRTKTVTNTVITPGSSSISVSESFTTTVNLGRLSWRQINSYQELRNTPWAP